MADASVGGRARSTLAAASQQTGPGSGGYARFFYFFILYFSFFTKIYFRFGNLQEYTPAAPLPGGRDLAARQPGDRGFCEKKFAKIFARRSLGAGRPAAGRPAPEAARQRGGRPWPPGCRATRSPTLI